MEDGGRVVGKWVSECVGHGVYRVQSEESVGVGVSSSEREGGLLGGSAGDVGVYQGLGCGWCWGVRVVCAVTGLGGMVVGVSGCGRWAGTGRGEMGRGYENGYK
jgi:hypothetical protein